MTSPLTVDCAADLSGSSQCPSDCRKCFYGGKISIQWSLAAGVLYEEAKDYVQYFPSIDSIEAELEALRGSGIFPNYSPFVLSKIAALQTWLDAHKQRGNQLLCNRCGLPYGFKTAEGFTQFYPKMAEGSCQCGVVKAKVEHDATDDIPKFVEDRREMGSERGWQE